MQVQGSTRARFGLRLVVGGWALPPWEMHRRVGSPQTAQARQGVPALTVEVQRRRAVAAGE